MLTGDLQRQVETSTQHLTARRFDHGCMDTTRDGSLHFQHDQHPGDTREFAHAIGAGKTSRASAHRQSGYSSFVSAKTAIVVLSCKDDCTEAPGEHGGAAS